MKLFHNASYRFIEMRRTAYVVSGIVLITGIAGMSWNIASLGSWQNYGVDFLGGSLVQVRFEGTVTDEQIRTALGGVSAPEVTRFGQENEYVIRASIEEDASITEVAENLESQLNAGLSDLNFEVVRTELVGAKVGGELQRDALFAILFSFLLTLIYIAMRFELRFGLAAVIATAHDILITLGFLALFRIEIALPTVAAILTILGYSLNDTIVVFDRIREELLMNPVTNLRKIILIAINRVLSRSILTSVTTLMAALSLWIFGAGVINDFAFVFVIGILTGTFSSIFIASPVFYWWHNGDRKHVEEGEFLPKYDWQTSSKTSG